MASPDSLLPPIDYTSKDYAAFKQDLISLIPQFLPEWTSRAEGDFGIVLIELFSYIGDILSYYGDRIANEAFLDTAVQRGSVLSIASMLDYVPSGTAAADVTVTFQSQLGSGVTVIPAGTQISTANSAGGDPIVFETDTDLTILGNTAATPTYTGSVSATQGITYALEGVATSDGSANQVYTLFHYPVIDGSVHIFVDEGLGPYEWTAYDRLIDASEVERAYQLVTSEDGYTQVLFGDNINGKVPANQAVITATYRVGCGAQGNVGANTLTNLTASIPNVISVTNAAEADGGADAESTDHIRKTAPKSLTTVGRAISSSDYANLALRVQGIAKASATSAVYSNVTLYVAPLGGGTASQYLKNKVTNYFSDKKMLTTTITIADPTYVQTNIEVIVNVLPEYDATTVSQAVKAALLNVLNFDNVSFAQTLSVSSLYRAINSTQGVDYGTVSQFYKLGQSPTQPVADLTFAVNELPTPGTDVTVFTTGGILPT